MLTVVLYDSGDYLSFDITILYSAWRNFRLHSIPSVVSLLIASHYNIKHVSRAVPHIYISHQKIFIAVRIYFPGCKFQEAYRIVAGEANVNQMPQVLRRQTENYYCLVRIHRRVAGYRQKGHTNFSSPSSIPGSPSNPILIYILPTSFLGCFMILPYLSNPSFSFSYQPFSFLSKSKLFRVYVLNKRQCQYFFRYPHVQSYYLI